MTDTQITESQTFTWELENFTKLAEPKDTAYFYSTNIDNKFFLRLYPQYEIRHLLNHIAVYLHRGPPYGVDLTVKYKIALIDSNGDKCFAEEIKTDFNDKNKGVPANGGLFTLSREYLQDRANGLLVGDRLTVYCEVEVISDDDTPRTTTTTTSTSSSGPIEITEENRKVIGDLDTLLETSKFADITLTIGEQQYKAHKAILAARSAVFETLFGSGEVKYELSDVPEEIAESLLRYIYTGLVPSLETFGKEVFVAADKYQLESLRALAEDTLCLSLTVETVVDALLLADQHSASKLKQVCVKFITENARDVMKTEAWEAMGQKRPLLLMQLYKDLVQVKK